MSRSVSLATLGKVHYLTSNPSHKPRNWGVGAGLKPSRYMVYERDKVRNVGPDVALLLWTFGIQPGVEIIQARERAERVSACSVVNNLGN